MAVKNMERPVFHYDDPVTGGPLAGGKVYVYEAGGTTTLVTYQENTLTNANTQPITLNAAGDADIWFNAEAKIVVKSADETVTHDTFDNISPVGGITTISGDYNLVQNGSFEGAESSVLTGWTTSPNDTTVSILQDSTNVTHGLFSVKFDGELTFGGGNIVSPKFDVTADSMLSVSYDYMVSNATTTNIVQIFWYKKDDTASATASVDILNAASGHPTSMTHTATMTPVPSDATRAEIKITGIDQGGSNLDADAWFDNVFVLDNQTLISSSNVSTPITYLRAATGATGVNPSIAAEGEANTGIAFKDSNGNEILIVESVASAVNEVTVTNAATGNQAKIQGTGEAAGAGIIVEGTGTNSSVDINSTGTGTVNINGVPTQHRGALVWDTNPAQTLTTAVAAAINFDSEEYDTDSIHDNATNNTRLTVPTGVTKVRLTAQASFASNATGSREAKFQKNGLNFTGMCALEWDANATNVHHMTLVSPVLVVVATDYFELELTQNSGGNLDTINGANGVNFSMEIIE